MSTTIDAVRERPILFSGPMVLAILDGRKTQTRRVILPQPEAGLGYQLLGGKARPVGPDYPDHEREAIACRYGEPGDVLWVRETFFDHGNFPGGLAATREERIEYRVDEWDRKDGDDAGPWTPSIHMPRWASRLTLHVTDVRVERVQDISEAAAEAEGLTKRGRWWDVGADWTGDGLDTTASGAFRMRWDALNAKRGYGWDANPWVWVISFKRAPSAHDCLTRGV